MEIAAFILILVRTLIEGCILWLVWKRSDAIIKILAKTIHITWTPVVIDGTLYVCIAMFLAIQSYFTNDEAYKYVNPYAIFWIKGVCAIIGAGAGALKMFRSREYSDHVKAQNGQPNLPLPTSTSVTTTGQSPAVPEQPKVNP